MLRLVRTKVASTVAEISTAEDYAWHKWLKIPENEKVFFPQPVSARLIPQIPLKNFDTPDQRDYLFSIISPKLYSDLGSLNFNDPGASTFRFKIIRQQCKRFYFEFNNFPTEISDQSQNLKFITFTQLFTNTKIENSLNSVYEFELSIPKVYDKLNTLNPSIIQIELLSEKGNNFSKKIYNVKFILNKNSQKYFKLGSITLNGIGIQAIPFYLIPNELNVLKFLSTINMSSLTTYESIKIESQKVSTSKLNLLETCTVSDNKIHVHENLLQIPEIISGMQNKYIVELTDKNEITPPKEVSVKNFNKELLCGEFLFDKYSIIVNHLKDDKKKFEINSVLIICGKNEFQGIGERSFVDKPEGWVESFKTLNFNRVRVLQKGSSFFNGYSECTSDVLITSYEILSNALREKLVDDYFINFFDLIIFDEFQLELENYFSLIKKIFKSRNRFTWFASTGAQVHLEKALQKVISEELAAGVVKFSPGNNASRKNLIKNHWLNLENLQRIEYEEAIASAKKEMISIVKEGNPFRFQSNIFTQVHKLKQACNFSTINNSSSKVDLLIQHIQIILASGRKVIVSSQYDNLGLKMIAPVLKNNAISFTILKNSVSDLDYKNFVESKSSVLLFSGRLSRLKIFGQSLPSIILFDNWWNPINNWHLENTFAGYLSEEIEIISYQVRNTIDEAIYSQLIKKFLLDKNLFETLQADNYSRLLTESDWLDIIDASNISPVSEESEMKIETWTQDYFISLINQFLRKLGYENLNLESGINKNEFILTAEYFMGMDKLILTCIIFLSESVTEDDTKKYLLKFEQMNNLPNKIFIFCPGKINFNVKSSDSISIIDGEKLRSYKRTFTLL